MQCPHHCPVGRGQLASSTAAKAATSGSSKPRAESKATPSCLHFMQWPNTLPFMLSRPHCSQAKSASLDDTYIVCTPALPLTFGSELGPCLQTAKASLCSVRRSALMRSCNRLRSQDVLLERIPALGDL